MQDRVIYSSFNHDSINVIHTLAPKMKTAWLTSRVLRGASLPAYLEAVHIEHYNSRLNKAQRVWTIDDPLKMKKLFAAPYVTGLITNRFEEAGYASIGRTRQRRDSVKLDDSWIFN